MRANQRVHVRAISFVGGNTTGGGVRMKQKTFVLQVAHRVPDSRWRHSEAEAPREGARSGRLGGLNVRLNDRLQYAPLASRKLFNPAHKFKASNDFGVESRRLRARRAATTTNTCEAAA